MGVIEADSLGWGIDREEDGKVGRHQIRKGFVNPIKQLGFNISEGSTATLENSLALC